MIYVRPRNEYECIWIPEQARHLKPEGEWVEPSQFWQGCIELGKAVVETGEGLETPRQMLASEGSDNARSTPRRRRGRKAQRLLD